MIVGYSLLVLLVYFVTKKKSEITNSGVLATVCAQVSTLRCELFEATKSIARAIKLDKLAGGAALRSGVAG
jgi:hypothetical protein